MGAEEKAVKTEIQEGWFVWRDGETNKVGLAKRLVSGKMLLVPLSVTLSQIADDIVELLNEKGL